MSSADMFGYAAAICTTIAYVPQAVKVFKTRHTKDISIGMFLLMALGLFLWLAYGILYNALPIIIANVVTLFLAGYILIMKIKLDYIQPGKKFSKV
ncbi:MAG: SemiSWEET transporter [Ignavibacteriaceae bacterium]